MIKDENIKLIRIFDINQVYGLQYIAIRAEFNALPVLFYDQSQDLLQRKLSINHKAPFTGLSVSDKKESASDIAPPAGPSKDHRIKNLHI
ncbi:hypothetical protein [Thalassomonas actiniarum]|uniref:Uncharacterized protein n=1 Tax=Thalassomonas actiniarum TaxID=485447 RepID=A0AAE9YRS5_9GAMM|nr:hypothetical protein [Thalassomonas actiniarum]WDD98396.1 hypothetical protein SG35_024520 [Thalassomonas actiniarum]